MKCCENCEYWRGKTDNRVCVNQASGSYGDFTDKDDCCLEFEGKESVNIEEIIDHLEDCVAEMNLWIDKLREEGVTAN